MTHGSMPSQDATPEHRLTMAPAAAAASPFERRVQPAVAEADPRCVCTVYLANTAPFNGNHAVARDPAGHDFHAYAFSHGNTHVVSIEAVMVDRDGNVKRRRRAPAYLGMAWPKHGWMPVSPMPTELTGEMPAADIIRTFAAADALLKREYQRDA